MRDSSWLIIGISGVTCGGKTTTATTLTKNLPNSTVISQDDYFLDVKDPRHQWIPELNHINFDILSSLDMAKMHQDVLEIIQKSCSNSNKKKVLIIEGFSIFNYKPWLSLFHLKYFFTLDMEECFRRRRERTYDPPDCEGYFEKCVWPEYLLQLEDVRINVEDVCYFDKFTLNATAKILQDVKVLV